MLPGLGFLGFALLFALRVGELKIEDGGPCFLFVTLVLGPPSLLSSGYSRYGGPPVEVEEGNGSSLGVGFGEGLVVGLLLELELEQVETGSSLCGVDRVPGFFLASPCEFGWRGLVGPAGFLAVLVAVLVPVGRVVGSEVEVAVAGLVCFSPGCGAWAAFVSEFRVPSSLSW